MTFILRVFLPEAIVKFMRMVMGHFVMFIESGMHQIKCISGHNFFLSPFLKLHKASGSITTFFLDRSVHNRGISLIMSLLQISKPCPSCSKHGKHY